MEFFSGRSGGSGGSSSASSNVPDVIGQALPGRANEFDRALLDSAHGVTSIYPPAAIRPDADTYARNLLLQYRDKGDTVARVIGDTEGYRLLLGGASIDFQKTPQTEYDATSLLANLTVAGEICTALVAPEPWAHPGWQTVLPYDVQDLEANLNFLTQRFLGISTADISETKIDSLKNLVNTHKEASEIANMSYQFEDYVPACIALALDVESLLL